MTTSTLISGIGYRIARKVLLTFAMLVSIPSLASATHEIIECDAPYETDIAAIHWQVDDKWRDFEDFVNDYADLNLSSCIENRFETNGDVKCKNLSGDAAGKAVPGASTIRMDEDWLDGLSSTQKNRRACMAALMAHEYAHSCYANESRADRIDEAAFEWWADVFGATNTWESCGIYD